MPPTFDSDHGRNQFTTRILLHHLLPEEDVRLLAGLNYDLTDNQKTALIFLREVGAVDNITYRPIIRSDKAPRTGQTRLLYSDRKTDGIVN